MTMRLNTTVRTAIAQAIITEAGASAKLKLYNGSMPAALGTPAGTLLATLTFGATIGTAGSGGLDFDEAGLTQSNGSHVNGTPTFARIEKSGGTVVMDIDFGGTAPTWTFTGSVVNGQNVSASALSLTSPHA